jgi:hypothetical protein
MVLVLTGRTVTTRWRKSTAAAGPMPPRTPNAAEGGGYGEPTTVMKTLQVQHVEFVGEHNFSVVDGADLLQGSLLGLPAFQPWAAMDEYELLDATSPRMVGIVQYDAQLLMRLDNRLIDAGGRFDDGRGRCVIEESPDSGQAIEGQNFSDLISDVRRHVPDGPINHDGHAFLPSRAHSHELHRTTALGLFSHSPLGNMIT